MLATITKPGAQDAPSSTRYSRRSSHLALSQEQSVLNTGVGKSVVSLVYASLAVSCARRRFRIAKLSPSTWWRFGHHRGLQITLAGRFVDRFTLRALKNGSLHQTTKLYANDS